jgi:hypothetical protein
LLAVELARPRPRLVHRFPTGQIMVVDDVHPVAWLLDADGNCERQLGWARREQPPRDVLVGPFRRSFADTDEVVSVSDVGVAGTIELCCSVTGDVRWAVGDQNEYGEGTARRSIHRQEFQTGTVSWTVRSAVKEHRRRVEVVATSAVSASWVIEQASVLSAVALEGGVLVVLRLADKRPWDFDPPRRLVWFTEAMGPRTWDLPPVEDPWQPHDVGLDDHALLMGISHSLHDLQMATKELGAAQPELSVNRPAGGMPVVSAAFTMPDGRRLRRTNEPYDVLGNWTEGLAGLTITLDEDINGGSEWRPGAVEGDRI